MKYEISNRMKDMQGSAIREIFKYAADPTIISLAGGNPAPELFPNEELSKIAERVLREQPVLALQYGITEGYPVLREAVKARLAEKEKIGREFDDLIIVSGGQQGIDLTTKVLVNEGDAVVIEEPSFIGATNAFRSYGAQLLGVPVEEDGMNIDALEKVLSEHKNVKFIYTIPTFQNPMGVTMSIEKRRRLYETAKKYGVLILEDNPYGELTFNGIKTPTIKSFDEDGIVLYSGSFSKILAPGLRLGFFCGPKEIVQKVVVAKQCGDVHTAMLPQILAAEFLREYDIDALIVKMRANYAHKCATMLSAMEQYFPKDITYTHPGGGLFIWCELGHGVDTLALAPKAIEEKVVYVPGYTFMADLSKPCSALRLNYSTMTDDRSIEGIRRLGIGFEKELAGK